MATRRLDKINYGLSGTVKVPGDKSISHRSVMFGAIAKGTTTVSNFLLGEDCLSTIACFRKLGVAIEQAGNQLQVFGNGLEGLKEPAGILDVGNSGTTIRLLLGILAGRPFHAALIGDESIGRRPMTRVTKPLSAMGATIDGRKGGEYTPLSIRGGNLKGLDYELPMASAQVKSSILFAGLQADGKTTILEPSKTRDHTERMIRHYGGEVEENGLAVSVKGGQSLYAADIEVPGDISSAAFFLSAAAINSNSELLLENVGINPSRTGILDVLKDMGADITVMPKETKGYEPVGDILIKTSSLKGIEIKGDLIPRLIDEIPIIALLATQAEGTTIIRDAHELKVKETNRIDTVVGELTKLGASIEATEDGMIIHGKTTLKGGKVSSHGDHRIGMMLAIAALICKDDVILEGEQAISVSYPSFFSDLNNVMK